MSYNAEFQSNNTELQEILATINALPEAGGEPIEPTLQEKSVIPTKSEQEIVADSGYDGLSRVNVGAIPNEYIVPSGTKNIVENGTYDVTQYASVNVNVSSSGGESGVDNPFLKLAEGIDSVSLTAADFGSITQLRMYAFRNAETLISVELPARFTEYTEIGSYAFYGCSGLTSVILPNELRRTVSGLFYGCSSLPNITIPNTVIQISEYTFYDCKAMEYIDLTAFTDGTALPILSNVNAFTRVGTNTTAGSFEIRVPKGRGAELAAMTMWSYYGDNIVEV